MKKKRNFQVSIDVDTYVNPLETKKKSFTLGEIANGYKDNSEDECGGVVALGGKLNVRPRFQRTFVVELDRFWRDNLIKSVLNNRPIGVFYFGKVDDGEFLYVNIDGQQRIMTLCEFINGVYSIPATINGVTRNWYFNDLQSVKPDWCEKILKYEPIIYVCEGSEDEMLNWFETINQPSSILSEQELRNIAFCKYPWLESAKRWFSSVKSSQIHEINDKRSKYCCKKYAKFPSGANGDGTRQECLEKAIEWASYNPGEPTDECIYNYMLAECQTKDNANDLIDYYKKVIDWAHETFLDFDEKVEPYVSFSSVEWGRLYYEYHDKVLDTKYISKRTRELLDNWGEMSKPSGVYEYVLRGEREEDKNLMGFRAFDKKDVEKRFLEQGGCDPFTHEHFDSYDEMHAHHIIAVENGGKRDYDNLVLLSPDSHRKYAHGGKVNEKEMKEIRDKWIAQVKVNK